jgi:hypothetical protein
MLTQLAQQRLLLCLLLQTASADSMRVPKDVEPPSYPGYGSYDPYGSYKDPIPDGELGLGICACTDQ